MEEKSAKDQLIDTITDYVDKVQTEVEQTYTDRIKALEDEMAHLHEFVNGSNKKRAGFSSFVEQVTENTETEKDLKRLKQENPELSEGILVLGGGIGYQSQQDHLFFQSAARDKVEYSPFSRGIKNLNRAATVNAIPIIDIAHDETDIKINDLFKKNKFKREFKGWVENCYIDGEIFILLYIRADGSMKIRQIDAQEIRDIEYHPQDRHTILSFERVFSDEEGKTITKYYAHADYFVQRIEEDGEESKFDDELQEDRLMFFFKYGYRDGERGEIPLKPILRYDRLYEDILIDLARLYHERAKVVWIKRLIGSAQSPGYDRTTRPIQGGGIRIETDRIRWRIENSRLSEHTSKEYGRVIRLAIAAGVSMPEAFIFQDSSSQSYASLRKADTPFQLVISDNQAFWAVNVEDIIKVMIRELVKRNILPLTVEVDRVPQDQILEVMAAVEQMNKIGYEEEKVGELCEAVEKKKRKITVNTEDLSVSLIFPKQMTDNPLLQAQAIEVLRRTGVVSLRTAIKLAGLDPEREIFLMSMEPKPEPEQGGGNRNIDQKRTQQPETNYGSKLNKGTA